MLFRLAVAACLRDKHWTLKTGIQRMEYNGMSTDGKYRKIVASETFSEEQSMFAPRLLAYVRISPYSVPKDLGKQFILEYQDNKVVHEIISSGVETGNEGDSEYSDEDKATKIEDKEAVTDTEDSVELKIKKDEEEGVGSKNKEDNQLQGSNNKEELKIKKHEEGSKSKEDNQPKGSKNKETNQNDELKSKKDAKEPAKVNKGKSKMQTRKSEASSSGKFIYIFISKW